MGGAEKVSVTVIPREDHPISRKAIEAAGMDPAEIDLFVMGTTTPDLSPFGMALLVLSVLALGFWRLRPRSA